MARIFVVGVDSMAVCPYPVVSQRGPASRVDLTTRTAARAFIDFIANELRADPPLLV
jgi:hypothetical protein